MTRPALLIVLTLILGACGEKIAIPQAEGIPVDSDYAEQEQWELTDPIDVLEANGRIHVLEGGPGTLTKYSTNEEVLREVGGLVAPTAMALDRSLRRILVTEDDGGGLPSISFFELNDLTPVGRAELTGIAQSAAGVAADGEFVYVSDPDSGVVHRMRWAGESEGWLVSEGVVCTDDGSRESPQFIFEPRGLAIDDQGFLLICDADTTRNWVVRFDPAPAGEDSLSPGQAAEFRSIPCPTTPVQSFVLGNAPDCGEEFEPGTSRALGALAAPTGLAFDTDGRIYVADQLNGRVQRFETDGTFEIVLGDGAGSAASLGIPYRVATWLGITSSDGVPVVIPGARVYVVDRETAQIRVFEDRRWTNFQDDV